MFRIISSELKRNTKKKKVLVLLGARQTGKTTLLKNIFPKANYINLEKEDFISVLNSRNLEKISEKINLIGNSDVWIFDEVQRLDDPGLIAKVIKDEIPEVQLIISGSSSLEIANKASESLAGRKKNFVLYPLTLFEFLVQSKKINPRTLEIKLPFTDKNFSFEKNNSFQNEINQVLTYGLYPELLNLKNNQEKKDYLLELVDSSILKDIYYLNLVKNTKNLLSLLKLLAYQVGNLVNLSELSSRIGISRKTVFDYLEILKKTFVIFTLPPYTKKRRDEIGKMEKVYFYDLGIRNALIEDFSPVVFRRDFGNIFENFVISEIKKINSYSRENFGMYYWRTKWGSEVDLVLYKDGKYQAIEIKTRAGAITKAFKETYPDTKEWVLTLDNITNVLVNKSTK